MTVVDASVVVGWLLQAPGEDRFSRLLVAEEPLAAPHLLDAEVAHALRRLNLIGVLSTPSALAALDDFSNLPLERYPHGRILERAFVLRHNASIYDALYLALAEALSARFLTMDRALGLIPKLQAEVEVIG
ncbi:MAG: type II toxin-antitoxin system VapC family toxin [Geminicoccaceae bacterium]|nr:type II toxin-antitoxin system VapC family toxin [Geminicoccaceae bacterium]